MTDLQLDVSGTIFSGCHALSTSSFAGGAGLGVSLPSSKAATVVTVRRTHFRSNRAVAAAGGTASGAGMLLLMPVSADSSSRAGQRWFDSPP